MEIKVRIEARIIIQEGETNINEILWAVKRGSREMRVKVAEGLVDVYQGRVMEMKIELPAGEYQEIPPDLKTEVQERLAKSRETLDELIRTFPRQGYSAASTYLRNAATSMFTVVEKWLELGYMPPKVISLLERVMGEVGRRLKKIGASPYSFLNRLNPCTNLGHY